MWTALPTRPHFHRLDDDCDDGDLIRLLHHLRGLIPPLTAGVFPTCFLHTVSFLSLDISDNTVREILILRGVAMGLTAMPGMTVAMNSIPPALIARSSSLTNVLRQAFAAFGTAIFATLLQTRQTFHQAMLSQTVTPDNLAVRTTMARVQQALLQHGFDAIQAKGAAVMAIYRDVVMDSSVMGFQDCFFVAAAICLLGLGPTLLLRGTGLIQRSKDPTSLE